MPGPKAIKRRKSMYVTVASNFILPFLIVKIFRLLKWGYIYDLFFLFFVFHIIRDRISHSFIQLNNILHMYVEIILYFKLFLIFVNATN